MHKKDMKSNYDITIVLTKKYFNLTTKPLTISLLL